MERFPIDPRGLDCLDAGASTGFTDRLLQGGAKHVVAVDVGYGQLAWVLRNDPRVTVLERTNVRDRAEALPARPELLVADLSFISLPAVLPVLVDLLAPGATAVLLVKPQFEAGPDDVGRGGVVRDPRVWERVLTDVLSSARALDLVPRGVMASPVTGPAGNVEFLVWAVMGGAWSTWTWERRSPRAARSVREPGRHRRASAPQDGARRGGEAARRPRTGGSSTVPLADDGETPETAEDLDLVVSVGGDGTFLRAAYAASHAGCPVLGVKVGRLGFLTEVEPDGRLR